MRRRASHEKRSSGHNAAFHAKLTASCETIESRDMHLTTALPLGAIYFRHWHTDDSEIGVAVAKAAFSITPDGQLKTIRPAPELAIQDAYEGDPAITAMITEQDIAPAKAATDLTILGHAHAPGGRPLPDWKVEVQVGDVMHYGFHVRGPSMWEHGVLGWSLSDPNPVERVPLTYGLAYGGRAQGDTALEAETLPVHEENPAGLGHSTKETRKGHTAFPAPQIGDIAEFMNARVDQPMTVQGTGPMGKAWLPRRHLAGTFDETWENTRHPRMPHDYDLGFWNHAHPRMQIKPFIRGDEVITLTNLHPGGGARQITLPGFKMMLAASGDNVAKNHTMKLDTVALDLRDDDPENHTATLLWRARVTGPDRFTEGVLQSTKLD